MQRIAFLASIFLLLFSFGNLSAELIGTQCIEVYAEKVDSQLQIPFTALWEDGTMGAFFNAGHIVTNLEKVKIEGELSDIISYSEAEEGGIEKVIQIYFFYNLQKKDQKRGPFLVPISLEWKIFSVQNNGQKSGTWDLGSFRNELDIKKEAESFGKMLIAELRGL